MPADTRYDAAPAAHHQEQEQVMGGYVCGVDIGGTFTDCVLIDDRGKLGYGKSLSSPADAFASGFFGSIEAAAEQLGVEGRDVYSQMRRLISHGSTVATNIVVERNGAEIGLLTSRGFEDTVRIMRGLGRATGEPPENLLKIAETVKPEPLVPADRVFGITERIDQAGDVIVTLDEDEVRAAAQSLVDAGAQTVAIAFLWSVRNPAHELRAKEIVNEIAPDMFVTISSDISRAVGEYERIVATLINAYVGPITRNYLTGVQRRLNDVGFDGELHLMQSHGGMVPLAWGENRPIFTIGSGPVGGLIACARVAEDLGRQDIIATDMGGTSFDIGIVKDGEPLAASETLTGKLRYRIPALEVMSIGAGGGSIAWVDPHGGGLRVGPQSASSLPGPACYGRGGTLPTVTDADLVLGYLPSDTSFGTGTGAGRGFRPQRDLAEAAIRDHIAEPLGLSVEEAALGIVEVANAKMANALENEVIGRGFDPRDFVLMSYGGAGPIHAAGYSIPLGIDTAIVPGEAASVWSAFGISQAEVRYQYERASVMVEPFSSEAIRAEFDALQAQAGEALATEHSAGTRTEIRRYVRIQFQWQLHELELRLDDGELTEDAVTRMGERFVAMYAERYGEAALLPGAKLQIVSFRLETVTTDVHPPLDRLGRTGAHSLIGHRTVWFTRDLGPLQAEIHDGNAMSPGQVVSGPAVVDLSITGIVVPPGTSCERRATGDFVLNLKA